MYFIHYIQTYASVNRKGSELQSYILKFKDCLLKDRNALDDLKEEIHCRIEELDAGIRVPIPCILMRETIPEPDGTSMWKESRTILYASSPLQK